MSGERTTEKVRNNSKMHHVDKENEGKIKNISYCMDHNLGIIE